MEHTPRGVEHIAIGTYESKAACELVRRDLMGGDVHGPTVLAMSDCVPALAQGEIVQGLFTKTWVRVE